MALKEIPLSMLKLDDEEEDEVAKKIILSEISVMKRFRKKMEEDPCPFLVRQEDVFRTDANIYITMELCRGGTLQSLLKSPNSVQMNRIEEN